MTAFGQSMKTSVRRANGELNLPKTTVHRILKREKMHPYRLQILHELFGEDLAARRAFAEEMLQVMENDDTILASSAPSQTRLCFAKPQSLNIVLQSNASSSCSLKM